MTRTDDLTGWLVACREGDQSAQSRAIAAVYEDLRRIARRRLRAERPDPCVARSLRRAAQTPSRVALPAR
jgi:hypothetical protein